MKMWIRQISTILQTFVKISFFVKTYLKKKKNTRSKEDDREPRFGGLIIPLIKPAVV